MKKRGFFAVLLTLLLLSNMATYFYTRFLFYSPAAGVTGLEQTNGVRFLGEVHSILDRGYYQVLDEERLFHGAVKGMLSSLGDPYTAYLPPELLEDMLAETTGLFSGIGVEIAEDEGEILILRVLDSTPAYFAGLLQGDRILEVEGVSMADVPLEGAARMLRGPEGTTVSITLRRPGEDELFSVALMREQIERDTVFSKRVGENFAYVEITSFDRDTGTDFRNTVTSLEREGLEGLIVDLRNNPGGLLDEAIEVGRFIVPRGEITRVVDRDGNVLDRYYSEAKPLDYPLVVLVNEYTASAAEIIGGALQDSKRALLVGKPTFGKASVQSLQNLSDGGALRYTIARYLTPAGRDLHKEGLKPDYEVGLPDEYYLKNQPVPRDLEPGDMGEKVMLLQGMLQCLGYQIKLTGVFDEPLLGALKDFQDKNNLPIGVLDDLTRETIRHCLREKADMLDEQLCFALDLLKEQAGLV
ncbi:MAG: S41 family peptidase [Dethiobacteria bacterium]|jgi:carboxyl-terminal processing protease